MSTPLESLNQQVQGLLNQCLQEGVLDDQFMQLMQLQDDANPDFVSEMIQLYFEDSAGKIEKLSSILHTSPVDFAQVDQIVHQFKGSSASFGAHKMAACCVQLRNACHANQADSCLQLCGELESSFTELKARLQQFLELEGQRKELSSR